MHVFMYTCICNTYSIHYIYAYMYSIYIHWLRPTPPPRYPLQASSGFWWHGVVLCYGAVFFLVVRFVAFTLLPKTVYLKSFWGPLGVILAPFGSILVALGSPGDPRGIPCRQKLIFNRFGEVLPPPLGSQFWYIFDKFLKKTSSRGVVL